MVTEVKGFEAWDIPLEQSLQQIESEWCALLEGPDLGDICWFKLTEEGAMRRRILVEGKSS